jgi:hypothetical protein
MGNYKNGLQAKRKPLISTKRLIEMLREAHGMPWDGKDERPEQLEPWDGKEPAEWEEIPDDRKN